MRFDSIAPLYRLKPIFQLVSMVVGHFPQNQPTHPIRCKTVLMNTRVRLACERPASVAWRIHNHFNLA